MLHTYKFRCILVTQMLESCTIYQWLQCQAWRVVCSIDSYNEGLHSVNPQNAVIWTLWKWNIRWYTLCFLHRKETDAEGSQLLKHRLREASCHLQTWGQTGRALLGELNSHALVPERQEQLTKTSLFFCNPLLLLLLSSLCKTSTGCMYITVRTQRATCLHA